jgi:predicted RNA-binding Zn-ribbon protein involved in translation (DUF1610 family)
MTDLASIGNFGDKVLREVVQKNVFRCVSCGSELVYFNNNRFPPLPCATCGVTDWEVQSINDTIVYNR